MKQRRANTLSTYSQKNSLINSTYQKVADHARNSTLLSVGRIIARPNNQKHSPMTISRILYYIRESVFVDDVSRYIFDPSSSCFGFIRGKITLCQSRNARMNINAVITRRVNKERLFNRDGSEFTRNCK